MSKSHEEGKVPNYVKFIISGLACCGAVVFCQPIDVIKNRMQLSGEGGKQRDHKTSLHAVKNIVQNEGFIALYDGFTANIARQIAYTMTRLGVFQIAVEQLETKGVSGFQAQVGSGLFAGFFASLVATPTDVALVRMTADRRLPENEQRKYKHVIDALIRIPKEEGIAALWTGVTPTVLRAMIGTAAQLVSYVQAKHYLVDKGYMKDGLGCHFTSSLISGFVYAFITTPLDVAKTRVQTMKTINGVPEYSGMFDVWVKTVKKEGVSALWKGFGPYYFRIAPNTVLLFVFVEQLTYLYKAYVLGDPSAKGGL
uniref:Putative mitochondrial fatty acid anion carrier protein/uncoupling protein n=1 Tax=Panstrongylus lignarius TaxID=156445 RepID=A0A224XUA2_9HEMI